jgi:hypothetical protein
MLRQMADMPAGTIGFEAVGKVDDDDWEEADVGFRFRHASSFDRVAVVSDEDWMRPALRALSFLLPGKARAFPVHDLARAKQWLSEEDGPGSPTDGSS